MARRRIKAAKITHVSLVPRGANRMPVIYKADDQTFDLDMLVKTGDVEKGELLAIVYAPEHRDSQGDIASADVIKDMMYEAARDGVAIDIRHDGVALGKSQAYVAESFIVQKNDPRFDGMKDYDGNAVDPTGSWGVVLKIEDPVLREKYRKGEWNGVSMAGTAVVESEKSFTPDEMIERACDLLAKRFGVSSTDPDHGDIDMKPEELAAALEKSNENLVKSLLEGVKALLPAAPVQKEEQKKAAAPGAPVFKGNPLDPEAIAKHQRALAAYELRKEVDWSDSASVAEYMEKLAAFTEEYGPLTEEDQKPAPRRFTNQPVSHKKADDTDAGFFEGVSAEDRELAKIGKEMAEAANKARGF